VLSLKEKTNNGERYCPAILLRERAIIFQNSVISFVLTVLILFLTTDLKSVIYHFVAVSDDFYLCKALQSLQANTVSSPIHRMRTLKGLKWMTFYYSYSSTYYFLFRWLDWPMLGNVKVKNHHCKPTCSLPSYYGTSCILFKKISEKSLFSIVHWLSHDIDFQSNILKNTFYNTGCDSY